jgi:hypothetical protein
MLASIWLTRARTSGDRTVPEIGCTTIWSELPDAVGNSVRSRFSAWDDCVCGSWNFVEKLSPRARLAANVPTSATSHSAKTIRRLRMHHSASAFTRDNPASQTYTTPRDKRSVDSANNFSRQAESAFRLPAGSVYRAGG